MNVAEHIRQLREAAKANRTEGAGYRKEAAKNQAKANEATAKAVECEDFADGWDRVIDLLEHGGNLADLDRRAAEETARAGTPDVYADFTVYVAVATDVMQTLSDMGLPLHAFQIRCDGVSFQHIARFGDDAARSTLRAVSERLGVDYKETPGLPSTLGGYTKIEACGPISGVEVSVWNHVDKTPPVPAEVPVDDGADDEPIPYVLAEPAGDEDFAEEHACVESGAC